MFEVIIKGIGFGLVLSAMVGPVFFGLLETSMRKGFKSGIHYALGVSASDLFCVILCYFGISSLIQNPSYHVIITWIGSFFICGFGLYYLFKPVKVESTKTIDPSVNKVIFKGFLLNILTPTVLFFWVGVMGFVSVNYENDNQSILTFFISCLVTLLGADILKSFLAGKIKNYLSIRYITYIQRSVGLIFFTAGAIYLIKNWRI